MNILTKNRILQEGDEYNYDGTEPWKKVPKDDWGLQVMFSKYKEVRRPSEPDTKGRAQQEAFQRLQEQRSAENRKPISPDSGHLAPEGMVLKPTAKAEKEKSPVPTPSGAGESLSNTPAQIDEATRLAHAVSHLPTIVSKKAHSQERDREIIDSIPYDLPMTDEERAALDREKDREMERIKAAPKGLLCEDAEAMTEFHKTLRETPETSKDASTEVAKSPASPTPFTETEIAAAKAKLNGHIKIRFPRAVKRDAPIWTGRNGTFTGYALEAMIVDDRIMLQPVGKRGVGNCAIQFPTSVIPQIIDWLAAQYIENTPK